MVVCGGIRDFNFEACATLRGFSYGMFAIQQANSFAHGGKTESERCFGLKAAAVVLDVKFDLGRVILECAVDTPISMALAKP